jgi:hypothetical protein
MSTPSGINPYSGCGPVETWEQPPKTIEDKYPGREPEHRVSQAPVELNPAGLIQQLGIPHAHRISSLRRPLRGTPLWERA